METKSQPEQFNLRALFDEQVEPLLKQIHSICSENGLPFFAAFSLACEEVEVAGKKSLSHNVSTSYFITKERAPMPMHLAYHIVKAPNYREVIVEMGMALMHNGASIAITLGGESGDSFPAATAEEAATATKH